MTPPHFPISTRLEIALLSVIFIVLMPMRLRGTVTLNEVMASNSVTAEDEAGDFPDWIELYNWGNQAIALDGYGLSDDPGNPFRWTFPAVVIEPKQFLVVWASGENRSAPGQPLHTNFSLSADGEPVSLTRPGGGTADSLGARRVPNGLSAGRQPDGTGSWVYFTEPTAGTTNDAQGYAGLTEPPRFSRQSGFFDEGFDLNLYAEMGATITYTLDGSDPDPANTTGTVYTVMNAYPDGPLLDRQFTSNTYTSPLPIKTRVGDSNDISEITTAFDGFFRPGSEWEPPNGEVFKATVVRARADRPGFVPSEVVTHTYFVGEGIAEHYSLPVVSIACPPYGLFDYVEGIYVPGKIFADWRRAQPTSRVSGSTPANYKQTGRATEQLAHLEYFEPEGALGVAQGVGIRIHGGWSRVNRQKALRVYSRSEYGNGGQIDYALVPGHQKQNGGGELNVYKRFLLHNGGQDNGLTLFRDAMAQSLIAHTGIDTQAYQPVVVFLNGEYWGIHNIRERYDRFYVATHYDMDPDLVVMLEGANDLVEGVPGDESHYVDWVNDIQQNAIKGTINDPGYLESIETAMDLDNMIHHYVAEIYYSNIDWPNNNLSWWRYKGDPNPTRYGHDGRWRWMMYDTDHGFGLFVTDGWGGYYNDYTYDTVAHALSKSPILWSNPSWATALFRSLVKNDVFLRRFTNTFADHLNSSFKPDRVKARIDAMQAVLAPEYPEHALRWNQPAIFWDGGDTWEEKIQVLRTYADNRIPYLYQYLNDHFDLGGTGTVTVDVQPGNAGQVQVNTLNIAPGEVGMDSDPYPWTGTYFQDVPVSLKAIPQPGYVFKEWQDAGGGTINTLPTSSMLPGTALTAVAVFERDPSTGFAAWQTGAFPDPADRANPDISGPQATPLKDGITNLLRYALDIPLGPAPASMLPQQTLDTIGPSFLFRRDANKTDIAYIVEATNSLSEWPLVLYDSREDPPLNNEGPLMRVRPADHRADTTWFFRLRVVLLTD